MKGKENKVADILNKMFHIVAISTCKSDLRMRIHEAIANDKFYLQDKKELQKE